MKKKFTILTAALMLLAFLTVPLGMRGQTKATKTEGFEAKAAATTYNGTVNISTTESDCGISWKIYYGCVSTNNKITGSKSAQMRWYKSAVSNLPYLESKTAIDNLTKIAFNAKVGDTKVKMDVWYSTNGTSWTEIASAVGFSNANTVQAFSYDIPSGGKFIKIGVSSSSTAPSSGNFAFIVDDVVFTYTPATSVAEPVFSPAGGNFTSSQSVTITCATSGAEIYYTEDGSTPTTASTHYTGSFIVSENKTLKAIAYAGGQASEVTTVTFNILTPLTTMDAIFAKATEVGTTSTLVAVTFNNWVVSGVNGSNVYVTDNNKKGFIIYQSSHGFSVGNILSGTAFCNLELYRGSAEIKGLTATTTGLSVTTGGVINLQTIGIDELGGVNTGAVFAFEQLNCSKTVSGENTTVILTDNASNELKVYTTLYSEVYGDFENGLTYNVTGVYQHYVVTAGTTKEIMPRSSADIEELTIPSITANNVNLAYTATSGEIPYTINHPKTGGVLTAVKDAASDWISNVVVDSDNNKVTFDVTQNMTDATRNGAITLTYTYNTTETVTKEVAITQGIRDYASLPVIFDGGRNNLPIGFTQTGLGTDYSSSPRLKFDTGETSNTNSDYLILKINGAATQLHFDIKGNGSNTSLWAGVFKVQTSEDGSSYSDLKVYSSEQGEETLPDATETKSFDLGSSVRYIKWIYTTKTTGNVALGNIRVSDNNYDIFVDKTVANFTIPADKVCTIYPGATLEVTTSLTNEATTNAWEHLIIKDGGQLKTPNAVNGTIEKAISGYGTSTNGKYVLLATPATMDACNNTGMWPTGDQTAQSAIDFYSFDQNYEGAEWRNFKYGYTYFAGPFCMTQGQGYLYANPNDVTLTLQSRGYVSPISPYEEHPFAATNANIEVPISYNDGKPFAGYNLVGNPFTCNAYINREYYRMNDAGDAIIAAASATTAIKPCEGIFVLAADATDNKVTFSATKPSSSAAPANVVINLKESEMVRDRAIVNFGNERNMPRFQFNEAATKLYIPQNGKDYAVVSTEAHGEMPVNFKAATNGTYTISVETENIEANYLHLIDNITGMDVDLLATPNYTFEASKSDYASRFRLVFSANSVNENVNDDFAFISNGQIILNNVDADATIQVIDALGRMITSTNANNRIYTDNMAPGVYVLHLINGNSVKTQKIVVK